MFGLVVGVGGVGGVSDEKGYFGWVVGEMGERLGEMGEIEGERDLKKGW